MTGTLTTTLQRLKPYYPESRELVERRNGYFETSFMPGRDFTSPADFNAQLCDWLDLANARMVRTTRARPVDLLDADRAALLPLPPVPPSVSQPGAAGTDNYVRIDSNDYSFDAAVIGRFVDVRADLSCVHVRHEGRLVAAHDRVWAPRHDDHRPASPRHREAVA